MKAKLHTSLALSVASAAALVLVSAGVARADGMPARAAPAAYQPVLWSGIYVGTEGLVEWDHTHGATADGFVRYSSHRDSEVNFGLFIGAQRQWGNFVLGVEFDFIGNEFDTTDHRAGPPGGQPVAGVFGNCVGGTLNCTGRVSDVITLGPRLGYAQGNWMAYVTGGWATGNSNFRAIGTAGTTAVNGAAVQWADFTHDGWFVGGGLDWKLSSYAVIGIEYRHIDLNAETATVFNPQNGTTVLTGAPTTPERLRQSADADMVLLRASLLFNPLPAAVAPLK